MSTIKIQITFDVVSPESAEHGDFADHGFYGEGGWKFSIADEDFYARCERDGREKALADMTPEPDTFDSVDDAVDFLSNYGPFEPSCHPLCESGGHDCWLTQADGDEDYSTGEVTRLSFHLDGVTRAVRTEILMAALA